ncbi:SNF2 helicase associated domain-containing protein [Fervidicella metallireducens]|uniref:SNF2 helicase associated domain-containing protein n=1 Tax=Fervidicella metallireducens TaxID=655338 RepID=UPI003BFA0B7B
MKLNDLDIRRASGEAAYRKGYSIYKEGMVNIIDIEYDEEDNIFYVGAEVESSSFFDSYTVELVISEKKGILEHNCECPAYFSVSYSYPICKHIVAVIFKFLEIYRDSENQNYSMTKQKGLEIIEQIKTSYIDDNSVKEEVKLEFYFDFQFGYERVAALELKIGTNKMYVVKNMKSFLSDINFNKSIEFGKGFTFDTDKHVFNDSDKKIIGVLLEIYESAMRIGDFNYNMSKFFDGKKIYLSQRQFKRVFELMAGRQISSVKVGNQQATDTYIINDDIPLKFNLKRKKEEILLEQEDNIPVPLTKNGDYFFFENKIYKPSDEQIKLYLPIYNALVESKERAITFDKSLMNQVASYVIPNLKKIGKAVSIDKKLEKNFYQQPLKLKFYFDKYDEGMSSKVEFIYGDISVNPFKDSSNDASGRILVRDAEGEIQVNSIYRSFGFEVYDDKYILKDTEKMIKFLSEGMPKLQELGEVYYSDEFKNIKIYTKSSFKSSVRLNENDLLEFSFKIEGVDNRELKDIFKAVKEKRKYYRLKDGGFIQLDTKELNDVADLISYLDIKDSELEKDKVLLSKYNAMYLDQSIVQNEMLYVERNKKFKELVNTVKDIKDADFEVPKHLEGILRSYQKTGFKWFKTLSACGFGGILADEMGLGKTLQTIAFLASEVEEQGENKKPALIVAPTSLVYNWKNEVEKFSPNLKAVVISGNKKERESLLKEIEEADMVITSYPLIRRDIDEYKDIEFSYCILDEAQQIKNPASLNAQSVKDIKARGRFALTGTPIENSLTELWSIFDFIMPGYLMSHGKFVKQYETPIAKNKSKEALEELNKHIKPFILRRFKREVVKELPPKIEHKIVVEMTEEQKKLYAAYLASAKEEIDEEIKNNGFNKSKIKILSLLTRLRQICCDPSSFLENYEGESGKMLALDELLEESIESGHRILLFSQFTSVLKNIEIRFKKNKISYMYLDGQTPSEKRIEMVNSFNQGTGSVFLISLKAGGTGLNLTGADVVIHFDPWWNPAAEQQAVDRAHRIGQRKTVEVIKLLAQGTIEEKIFELQEKKKEIIKNVLDEDNSTDVILSTMSQEELEELFK